MNKLIIFTFSFLLFSCSAFANKDNDFSIFVHRDSNESDYYSSVGVEIVHKSLGSNLGFAFNSSLGYAEVADTYNQQHSFLALEGGMKIGYFSDFSLYLEFGVDLLELAFSDRDDDEYTYSKRSYDKEFENDHFEHDHYHHWNSENNIDGYIGIGSSVIIEHIKITGFIRLREISGYNWDAKNIAFSGVELALVF